MRFSSWLKLLCFLLVWCHYYELFAQEQSIKVPSDEVAVACDIFGAVYVSDQKTLSKYINGETVYIFSRRDLGIISDYDVTNPHKIAVLFGDARSLLLLDSKGVPLNAKIDLAASGLFLPAYVCANNDGAFWVYDAEMMQIFLIDMQGTVIFKSTAIDKYADLNNNAVLSLGQNNEGLYLDLGSKLLLFTKDGAFLKSLSLPKDEHFVGFHKSFIVTQTGDNGLVKFYDGFIRQSMYYSEQRLTGMKMCAVNDKLSIFVKKSELKIVTFPLK